jgi:hypothetical protein
MSEAELEDQMPESIISPICRAFLRQEYDLVNPKLEEWLKVLSEVSHHLLHVHCCVHRMGTCSLQWPYAQQAVGHAG